MSLEKFNEYEGQIEATSDIPTLQTIKANIFNSYENVEELTTQEFNDLDDTVGAKITSLE